MNSLYDWAYDYLQAGEYPDHCAQPGTATFDKWCDEAAESMSNHLSAAVEGFCINMDPPPEASTLRYQEVTVAIPVRTDQSCTTPDQWDWSELIGGDDPVIVCDVREMDAESAYGLLSDNGYFNELDELAEDK